LANVTNLHTVEKEGGGLGSFRSGPSSRPFSNNFIIGVSAHPDKASFKEAEALMKQLGEIQNRLSLIFVESAKTTTLLKDAQQKLNLALAGGIGGSGSSGGSGGGRSGWGWANIIASGQMLNKVYSSILGTIKDMLVRVPLLSEELYYMSRRLITPSGGLFSMRFAGEMIGLPNVLGQTEAMGAALRNNPGLQALLKQFVPNYQMGTSLNPENQLSLVNRLHGQFGEQGYFVASQFAQLFGMGEQEFRQMYENLKEVNEQYAIEQERLKVLNVDTTHTDKAFVEFHRQLMELVDTLEKVIMKVGAWLAENIGTPILNSINEPLRRQSPTKLVRNPDVSVWDSLMGKNAYMEVPNPDYKPRTEIQNDSNSTGAYISYSTGNKQIDTVRSLMSMGYSRAGAIGIMTVLDQGESGLNPNNRNPYSGAYGIAQWLGDRRNKFQQLFGHSMYGSSRDEQLQFLDWELRGGDRQASTIYNFLKRGDISAGEAAFEFRNKFERPEPGAYSGIGFAADRWNFAHKNIDLDINHSGTNLTINNYGSMDQNTIAGARSILDNDQKMLELRLRAAVSADTVR